MSLKWDISLFIKHTEGILWLGRMDGIRSFDGESWTDYLESRKTERSLKRHILLNRIMTIMLPASQPTVQAGNGLVPIGESGISKMVYGSGIRFRTPTSLMIFIASKKVDSSGIVWFGTWMKG